MNACRNTLKIEWIREEIPDNEAISFDRFDERAVKNNNKLFIDIDSYLLWTWDCSEDKSPILGSQPVKTGDNG